MKIAYLCALAHVTVINKPDDLAGRYPSEIPCTCLGCESLALVTYQVDESVETFHEFYVPAIVMPSEQDYVNSGGLMFRQIQGSEPRALKNEYKNTEEQIRLGNFMLSNFKVDTKKNIVDTAIDFLKELKGYRSVSEMAKGQDSSLN